MKVKEYLFRIGINEHSSQQICFVIAKVLNPGHCKELCSTTTPIRCASEWFQYLKVLEEKGEAEKSVLNFNVLNTKQPVTYWLSGVNWNPAIEKGLYKSLFIISDEELYKAYYSKQQADEIIEYIDKKIEEEIKQK